MKTPSTQKQRLRGLAALALELYGTVLTRAPDDADALVGRGTTLLVVGRLDPALADVDQAVRLAPRNAAARFAYGVGLLQSGDDGGAVAQFDQAFGLRNEAGAEYAEAHWFRARAHERVGRRDAALADYRAFAQLAAADRALADEVAAAQSKVEQLESR